LDLHRRQITFDVVDLDSGEEQRGVIRPATRLAFREWLERFDLAAWAGRRVDALSKGMAQKIQFVAAVVARPELLILDEPFSGLDPVNTDVLKDAVLELRRQGTTIVFSTHDMRTAELLCDRIFMIFRGKKVLDGTLDEIQSAYGFDTVVVRTGGGRATLDGIPGLDAVNDHGNEQEVRLGAGADPQAFLRALSARTAVQKFEIVRPSLNDIFVRIARPEAAPSERAEGRRDATLERGAAERAGAPPRSERAVPK